MKVKLLNYTPNPEKTVYLAARQCFSQNFPEGGNQEDWEKLIKFLISHQHFSPFEHISFTFSIQEISRVCSHQLVRHRLASYSQQSQRRVSFEEFDWITPPKIARQTLARETFQKCISQIQDAIAGLYCLKIPIEDIRYLLPQAVTTKIIVTMNARELFHFFEERLCKKAQWEIRSLANKMLQLCLDVSPIIFSHCGPKCARLKYCPEGKRCEYFSFWKEKKWYVG